MSRWAGPADLDAPDGADAAERAAEPTLRETVAGALFDAGLCVLRRWPLDRGGFPGEVVLHVREGDGLEWVDVEWWGPSKASARRLEGAMGAARRALEGMGIVTRPGGGMRLEAAWAGTPMEAGERGRRMRETPHWRAA